MYLRNEFLTAFKIFLKFHLLFKVPFPPKLKDFFELVSSAVLNIMPISNKVSKLNKDILKYNIIVNSENGSLENNKNKKKAIETSESLITNIINDEETVTKESILTNKMNDCTEDILGSDEII